MRKSYCNMSKPKDEKLALFIMKKMRSLVK